MLDTRYFLANLLCVFIPLFGLEVWRSYGGMSPNKPSWTRYLLATAILISSVLCTFFNFAISDHMNVNLSIVSLSMGFFLLSWMMGLLILALYVLLQIVISLDSLSHGHLTLQIVKSVLLSLPQAIIIVCIFALVMCLCSFATRKQSFPVRASGFVFSLILYTLIDYFYVQHVTHANFLKFAPFAAFMVVFNFTFIVAIRLMIGIQDTYTKRLEEVRIEKLELISQLAASVAHEVRNPITVVRGYAQLMQREDYDAAKTQAFLQNMVEELDRAQAVITDYLHLAKDPINSTNSEINLSLTVDHVVDVLLPYAVNKNVQLQSTTESDLFIYGNPAHVTQAIINLVKNAVEAHDHGGTVNVHLKQVDKMVQLKVSDSGKGIPQAMLHKLGEPYLSTKKEGTGLGLTLVYKVMNDVKGKIDVQSKEGAGTTFSIIIPRQPKPTFDQNHTPNTSNKNQTSSSTANLTNKEEPSNNTSNQWNAHKRVVWTM